MTSARQREAARYLRVLFMVEREHALKDHPVHEIAGLLAGVDQHTTKNLADELDSEAKIRDLDRHHYKTTGLSTGRGAQQVTINRRQADELYALQAFLVRAEKVVSDIVPMFADWANTLGEIIGAWQQAKKARADRGIVREINSA